MHGVFDVEAEPDIIERLVEIRYRREFHLSAQEYACEPEEKILEMQMLWELEGQRAKLEEERQAFEEGNKS